ncbi:ABC transporter permease [Dyadobacter beijingensis]|uniref:ABC transporter permease n=1 Tax=Dyadobacter beijingensis TaxID=365489 RepID=A0ABQ2HEW7_9BACT|nr:ABC transporter permease [Dyadobacter beijingensis]GGM79396.1 ABC transporter permease [Dyadobacter beijingensis]
MLKNYLKITFRNLLKNKGYSGINIGGLAIGMGVAMLIGLWIYDELSFNHYFRNHDRIGQILQNQVIHSEKNTSFSLPVPYIAELKSHYAGYFKHIAASSQADEQVLTAGEVKLSRNGQFMDAVAPEMFSMQMLRGSRSALEDPQGLLLSQSTAEALFGQTDPMNKIVKIGTDLDMKVTGVYADFPKNTKFSEVQFIGSWDYFLDKNRWMKDKKWDNHAIWIFAELADGVDFATADAGIRLSELSVIKRMDDMREEAATRPEMWLHPMNDWHLYSGFKNGAAGEGPVKYVWMVGMIGFFVLLLACINFVNLSTARSEKRAREVGVRKAIGSLRAQLVVQFFSESFVIVLLSFLVALGGVVASLAWFNNLAAKQMSIPWDNAWFWLCCAGFILLTSLLAGSYPAFFLTSFQPVKVLKGASIRANVGRFAYTPRQLLVVLQFTISVTLIICTSIVYRQIRFAKERPVGYTRDGLLMISMKTEDFYNKTDVLRTELKNTGMVDEVAESQSPVTGVWSSNEGFSWKGMPEGFSGRFATLTVTPEYAATVGWEFKQGRNLSRKLASDSAAFVINESAARLLGMPDPLGEVVSWKSQWMTDNVLKHFTVIGVVKDMVMESPFEPVKPTVFFLFGSPNWINIRLNAGVSASAALTAIEKVFKKLVPAAPFEYKFADQEYDAKFRAEERIGKLAGFFAGLAILISCLGLLGLASFTAEQRTKEIGIRKVLGASVASLWRMLSKDFVLLVATACLLAAPLAWYAMREWLASYPYRTEMNWWIFALAGAGALVLTLATVSYQAVKAAWINPVKSLKSE